MTERGRFDPSRMRAQREPGLSGLGLFSVPTAASSQSGGSALPPGAGGEQAGSQTPQRLTVSQLAAMIDGALRTHFPQRVRVVGEISQFRERTHWYFDLKDAEAVISCVMFAAAARKAGFTPTIGQEVVISGRVEFYVKQGRTTLMVDRIEPIGEGALDLAFRKLCDELRGLGWFNEDRKRRLPAFPQRIAVVTSLTGAALQDVLDTLHRRSPMVEVATVDVRVQGEFAANEVTSAVRWLGRRHVELGVDAVLVTRGGGSREDLWAFNDRELARAIVECEVPVVAAIGHETDTTIAELVADLRCATPTQAAVRIAPDASALNQQAESLLLRMRGAMIRCTHLATTESRDRSVRLDSAMRHRIAGTAQRLAGLHARLERHRPIAVYAHREQSVRRAQSLLTAAMSGVFRHIDLDAVESRLRAAMQRSAGRFQDRVEQVDRALELVGPAAVLRRGYSVTLDRDGRAVRSASAVALGDRLRTRFADGQVTSEVVHDDGRPDAGLSLPPPRPRKRRSSPADAGGPMLFGE